MRLPEPLHTHTHALSLRFRDGGLRAVCAFLVAGARAQLSKRETQLVIVKRLDEIAVPLRRGDVRVEPVERRHLPALRELNRERGDLDGDARFADDLDAGHGGFVGFNGDELISCYWWVDGGKPPHRDMRELGLGIELGAGDAYGYDLYVHKGHRAGGTVNDCGAMSPRTTAAPAGPTRRAATSPAGMSSARACCGAGATGSCNSTPKGAVPE
jgi:hypothetical protein